MKKVVCFIICLQAVVLQAQPLQPPWRARTDLLLDGMQRIISNPKPKLSWQAGIDMKAQTAYRLLVASSPLLLNEADADYWNTGKILSRQQQLGYNGKPLEPGKMYYWKVQVWDEKGTASSYSAYSSFLLNSSYPPDTVSHYALSSDLQQPEHTRQKGPGHYFLDFGKDGLGKLQFHIDSDKDDTLFIEAGEMAGKDYTIDPKPGRNIRYIKMKLFIKAGAHDYTLVWPENEKRNTRNPIRMPDSIGEVYPFRYVSIQNFPGIFHKGSVQRVLVYYPFDEDASSFVSGDTVLNQVWDLCKYSIKATSFTGFYVDGDRERIPYEADAVINQLSHYAVDAEYSMARRTMAYLLYNPTWPTEWSLQNIILAWNDYMYTGDNSFLKKYYSELQVKTLMALADGNGLISTRNGKQTPAFLRSLHKKMFDGRVGLNDNVDWPHTGVIGNEKEYPGETDGYVYTRYNAVVNAFYYNGLVLMHKIATALDKTTDAAMYNAAAAQVLKSYRKVFSDPVNGLIKDGDGTNHVSLHSNMFALNFGLVPGKDIPRVIEYIKSRKMACSVYGAQFLLDALFDNGADEYALSLITATTERSWYNMIRVGSTITMEAWDKLYKPNLDLNHAWGAAPANHIVRKLMGVEPLTPGFDRISIKPRMGGLAFAKMKTPTIRGDVSVHYQQNGEELIWDIIIPGGTIAEFHLPTRSIGKRILVDGKSTTMRRQGIIEIAPGKHRITVQPFKN